MDAFLVVEAIDVTGHGSVQLGIAGIAALARELGLERMEEALYMGVVLAMARPIHAGHDAVGFEEVLEAIGRVFDAAVRMEQQPGPGLRAAIARLRALSVTSMVRLRESVQPTMRRENKSITVAR